MKQIALTGTNLFALVDEELYPYLILYDWRLAKVRGKFYARTYVNQEQFFMHSLVFPTSAGFIPDHINGNGLDNQRHNLRISTYSENAVNRGKQKNNTSGYKGVFLENKTGKWRAQIRVKGVTMHLGTFENKLDAARCYNAKAVQFFGEFAQLNAL